MITLEQYRKSLGKHAEGLSNEEVQKRLNYTIRAVDVLYGWWEQRKGTPRERITALYTMDVHRILSLSGAPPMPHAENPKGWKTVLLYEKYRSTSK